MHSNTTAAACECTAVEWKSTVAFYSIVWACKASMQHEGTRRIFVVLWLLDRRTMWFVLFFHYCFLAKTDIENRSFLLHFLKLSTCYLHSKYTAPRGCGSLSLIKTKKKSTLCFIALPSMNCVRHLRDLQSLKSFWITTVTVPAFRGSWTVIITSDTLLTSPKETEHIDVLLANTREELHVRAHNAFWVSFFIFRLFLMISISGFGTRGSTVSLHSPAQRSLCYRSHLCLFSHLRQS